MRRILLLLLSLTALATGLRAASPLTGETLKYKVQYKWGLVQKVAGYVTISLDARGDRYKGVLTAASAPWADGLYRVRDTLRCEVRKDGFLPVIYEKAAHEGNSSSLDVVRYSYSGGKVTGHCTRKKWKKNEPVKDEARTLEAEGVTLDMFSAFYYMRLLNYSHMATGEKTVTTVFSGKKKETLSIVYRGEETVKSDGHSWRCHHITFRFTSEDGKKSSDDMDAWITADASRIPVKLVGDLPVGKVRCFYMP